MLALGLPLAWILRGLLLQCGEAAVWLRRDARRLAAAASLLASGLTLAVAGIANGEARSTTTSRYISWLTDDAEADYQTSKRLACEAKDGGGVVLVAFGKQVDGGTRSFDGPGALYGYDHIARVAQGYADGLEDCTEGSWELVVATSNYDLNDPALGYLYGSLWKDLVEGLDSAENVDIVGGIDLEPGWGSRPAAEAWLAGWRSGTTRLVANASADGCPLRGKSGSCANGWDVAAIGSMVWGRSGDGVLPQIYRKDGAQAAQWGVIARGWRSQGGEPVFSGVMTQVRACELVKNANCPMLSLEPGRALDMLQGVLDDTASVSNSTDIGWG